MLSSLGFNCDLFRSFWLGFSGDICFLGLEFGSGVGLGSDLTQGLGCRLGLGLVLGLRPTWVPKQLWETTHRKTTRGHRQETAATPARTLIVKKG